MKRHATHAGSWYTDNKSKLDKQLTTLMEAASQDMNTTLPLDNIRAIIAPHAGFSYSGPTAAYAYSCVDITKVKRVFLLGPSHHVYIDGCALSQCDYYETPLGDLELDKQMLKELHDTGEFTWMSQHTDEDEHSIEMHLPFTYKLFSEKINQVKVVPIMVGSIRDSKERLFGELLSKYLDHQENLFIISSDFCHWGSRFQYTYYKPEDGPVTRMTSTQTITTPIHKSIETLDKEAIEIIERLDIEAFQAYLRSTKNTICGRHPIAVLLYALEKIKKGRSECVKYAQSSECKTFRDSSVSYASIYVQFE
ncbi:UPF0103-domain-containing protein [Backusella circina FSU 941]|nr:UPF0103-domain-containing protein [Backusella circina FSU 941]